MRLYGIIYNVLWAFVSINHLTSCSGKAFPSLVSSTNQYFESLCINETQNERFVESDGRKSSFFLELRSNAMQTRKKFCERSFTPSESHGFIIRLIITKNKFINLPISSSSSSSNNGHININSNNPSGTSNTNAMLNSQRNHGKSMTFKNLSGNQHTALKYHGLMNFQNKNQSKSCPLTIYSNNDYNYHQVLWQIDPCELEKDDGFSNENNWPVQLFEGPIRIHWEHNHNSIHSKLMITVLGKGDGCNKSNKFPCLTFSGAALFCISKDLICDNIRHCPNGNFYADDEDKEMCEKLHSPSILTSPTLIFDNEWEQQLMLWMQHAFGDMAPHAAAPSDHTSEFGLFDDVLEKDLHDGRPVFIDEEKKKFHKNENQFDPQSDNSDENSSTSGGSEKDTKSPITTKKNSSKTTLTGDLSKYGPWGYLMLGMLLCGGALLICGLWECCCRSNKNESHITASTMISNPTAAQDPNETQSSAHNQSTPPNYDELDPPPAYSVLFPNQKGISSSTSTTAIESSSQQQQAPPYPIAISGNVGGRVHDSMLTVPVVVVVPGGAAAARSNNSNNNNNNNRINNNTTSDLTPASSS